MNQFNSKLLLFGEYSIVKNGKGIAIPLHEFYGEFKFHADVDKISTQLRLNDFYEYLSSSGILSKVLDLKSLKQDIDDGLYFDSNIPLGHGIGSSGALCAALYYKYAFDFEKKDFYSQEELKYLLDMMALMESFYHGTSSGFDCLISLVNSSVLINHRNDVQIVKSPPLAKFGHFSLFETHIQRKTAPLVHQFLQDFETDDYFKKHFKEFQVLTNDIIEYYLSENIDLFYHSFIALSHWQFQFFNHMIPKSLKSFWENGLLSKNYFVKFCGAGGGGYFIVYSKEKVIHENLIHILGEA